jgi:predicted Zn-dependent peptidase
MAVQSFLLDNGLRVLLAPSSTNVVYAGIAVAAGTRDELPGESGMAHFVEHMSFKGTRRLTSMQILNRMDSVGGDLNAYTGKEETVYYSVFLREHLRRALPLLMDIVFNSTYPQTELEKEREVVIDEIDSYLDTPAEQIYDDFEAKLFAGHPLGRNILGDAERLRQYTTADLKAFVSRTYKMEKAVLFVKGNVTEKEVMRIVKGPPLTLPVREGVVSYENCEADACSDHSAPSLTGRAGGGSPLHQSHVMLGARSYAMTDPRHIGIALLSNLLGGPAMSSRLSLALRERTGLVYTVESNVNAYTDTGVWSVYFGCDHADVQRCLRLVRRELHRLTDKPLSQRTLDAARRQIKGQMAIAADNSENAALSMAKLFLHTNRTYSLDDRFAQLDALTPDVLHAIACDVLDPDRLTTLVFQ